MPWGRECCLEGLAGEVLAAVEGECAQVGKGLAGVGEPGGAAARKGGDEMPGEGKAAIHLDRGGHGAAGVDHVVEGLPRELSQGVPLTRERIRKEIS